MEYLVVNSVGKYKEKTLNGRKYLVVPVRMIVPGVMVGSKGPLFYSEKQIANNYKDWNGIPLVAPTHPTLNNKPISAKLPSIKLKYGIGQVINSLVSKAGCLDADAQFDTLLCNRVDPRIIPWIRKGEKIEVSTGLGADVELVENGVYKGTSYIGNAVNFRPDHLAILCNEVGACSVAMGCGVGVINKRNFSRGVLITNENKEEPSMDIKSMWQKIGEKIGILSPSDIVTNEASYMDLVEALSRQLKDKYSLIHKELYPNRSYYDYPSIPRIEDVFSDSVIFCYENKMWKLGYSTASSDTITLSSEEPTEVQRVTSYEEITTNAFSSGKEIKDLAVNDLWEPVKNSETTLVTNQEGNTTMPLTPEVRKTMVDGLIANCNCQQNVPWKGKDVNTLNTLSDDTIQAYDTWRKSIDGTTQTPSVVVNSQTPTQTVLTQSNPHQESFFVDAKGNRFVMNPITNQLVQVGGAHIQSNIPVAIPVGNPPVNQIQQIPQGTAATPTQVANSTPTNPSNIQAYLNDKFKDAPPEVINAWNQMQEGFVREKSSLVEKLTLNMQGEVKDQAVGIYNAMDVNQLRTLAAGIPTTSTQQQTPVVNWLGNAPVPMSGSTINEKPLDTPKVDWKEAVTNSRGRRNGK